MSWEKMKLKDVCLSIADGDHRVLKRTSSGVPLVTISDIDDNQFDLSNTAFVSKEYYDSLDAIRRAQKDDILFTVVGSIGIPVLMRETIPLAFQRDIALLRPNKEKIIPEFLYYTMQNKDFGARLNTIIKAATHRVVNIKALRNFEIFVPDMETQQHIVNLVSVYDALIQNSRRQIMLLKEAAERIYKEWFVNLRFAGYEKADMKHGIPEGWSHVSIADVLEIKYGKAHKKLSNGSVPAYGSGGRIRYVDTALYRGESVLIPRKGSLENIFYVTDDFWATDTMFYTIPKRNNVLKYMYHFLKGLDLYSYNNGTAVPSLTAKTFSRISVVLPTEDILTAFDQLLQPMYTQIELLDEKIKRAGEARDRLLMQLFRE